MICRNDSGSSIAAKAEYILRVVLEEDEARRIGAASRSEILHEMSRNSKTKTAFATPSSTSDDLRGASSATPMRSPTNAHSVSFNLITLPVKMASAPLVQQRQPAELSSKRIDFP